MSQNYLGQGTPKDEHPTDKALRLKVFVGASRILGRNVNDDGTINRNNRPSGLIETF
jgi:hypothetical protein